jgi:D-alanyl-D-alanine carboxypeptidase (penicillin-binding protein 5/6)
MRALALTCIVLLTAGPWGIASAAPLTAKSVVVMDAATGKVIESQEAETPVGPASLVKMMTLYLIFKSVAEGKVTWDEKVRISEKAWRTGGSKMFIRAGDRISMRQLAEGIGVVSGNDACIAVAEHLSGTEEGFAEWMNEEGARLGLTHTHFATATGFPAPGQETTATDMVLLGRALITDFPESIEILSTRTFQHEGITQHNRNRLLWKDIGVDGIKTGHTEESGFHLVATASRNGQRFIVGVMGAKGEREREAIAQRFLTAAFRNYATITPLVADVATAQTVVWKGQDDRIDLVPERASMLTVKRGEEGGVEVTTEVEAAVAPVTRGDVLGTATVHFGGEVVDEVPLVAAEDVAQAGFLKRIWHSIVMAFKAFLDILF